MPAQPGTILTIARPDDFHLHLRDGAMLRSVLPDTLRRVGRAVIMPNLDPPIDTVAAALDYRRRILELCADAAEFEPWLTLYLRDAMEPTEIDRAAAEPGVIAAKLYPAGVTTNARQGISDLEGIYPLLERMEQRGLPLLVHGEVGDPDVDIFDRESVFIDRHLQPLTRAFPTLKIVLEHITTAGAVEFVRDRGGSLGATITAHHLLLNRNDIFRGGIRPHHYCLPILKTEADRRALVAAAVSGEPWFFAGSDSAPHPRGTKETGCGCAGIYTAHALIELYAEAFDAAEALDRLEPFVARHGADFYGLPRSTETIGLVKKRSDIVREIPIVGVADPPDALIPFRAGGSVEWSLAE